MFIFTFYDRNGARLDTFEWAVKFADNSYQILADDIAGPLWISTVWMGHACDDESPPLIFETAGFLLVNGKPVMSGAVLQYRYATEVDALRGHALVVSAVRLLAQQPELTTDDVLARLPDLPNEEE